MRRTHNAVLCHLMSSKEANVRPENGKNIHVLSLRFKHPSMNGIDQTINCDLWDHPVYIKRSLM